MRIIDYLVALFCVLMVMATPYKLLGLRLPELLGLISVCLILLNQVKGTFIAGYQYFFVYMFIIPGLFTIIMDIPGDIMTTLLPVSLSLFSLFLYFLLPNVNKQYVVKYYRYAAIISILFFFLQEITFRVTGYKLSGLIPYLELIYSEYNIAEYVAIVNNSDRFSSFFLEPSHFAQFIFPLFCIGICKYFDTKKINFDLALSSIAILFARSGCGYLEVVLAMTYLLWIRSSISFSKKIISFGLVYLLIIIVINLFSDTALVSYIMERSSGFSISYDESTSQSGFIRMYRGYYLYGAMDFINQIFGIGAGSSDYVLSLVDFYGLRQADASVFNGFQALLIFGGIVGTTLFIIFMYRFTKPLNMYGKCVIFALIALCLSESILYNSKMFLYLLLAYSLDEYQGVDNEEETYYEVCS